MLGGNNSNAVGNACSSVAWISNGPIAGGVGNGADGGVSWVIRTAVLNFALGVYYLPHSRILNPGWLLSNLVELLDFYCRRS